MKRILIRSALVAALLGVILAIVFFHSYQHWLAVHTGTVNESGPFYGFWSGFGSDIGEATLIATVCVGIYTGFRKVNCHAKGCWRIGHHQLEGTPYHLCSHHHPDVPSGGASHSEILEHHRKWVETQNLMTPAPDSVETS